MYRKWLMCGCAGAEMEERVMNERLAVGGADEAEAVPYPRINPEKKVPEWSVREACPPHCIRQAIGPRLPACLLVSKVTECELSEYRVVIPLLG